MDSVECDHAAELARTHLIEQTSTGAYTMHDLLRAYAVEAVADSERSKAIARLLDQYEKSAAAATDAATTSCFNITIP